MSEYQERRQALIAKHGAFNHEEIERLWEEQVVIPPGMIVPEPQAESEEDDEDDEDDDEDEDNEDDNKDEEQTQDPTIVPDDRNLPPKRLSLFRASRLVGKLAKQ